MERPRHETTPEQEAMKGPLRGLAEALDINAINGISVEVLVDYGMKKPRAEEIFGYLERNGAIDKGEGSAAEGYFVNGDILKKLIEEAPSNLEKEKASDVLETIGEVRKEVEQEIKEGQVAAERGGATDPASKESLRDAGGELRKTTEQEATIFAAREAFVQESAAIVNEKLVASIDFSPEFERELLFERGPEKIKELLNNLRELIVATPAKLGEFAVEIFENERVELLPERKTLALGIYTLREHALPKTAGELERVTQKIAGEQEVSRERERIRGEEEKFNSEEKAFKANVGGFTILPIYRQAVIEKGDSLIFFAKLEEALNLVDAAVARELKGRQIAVIDGDEVSFPPHGITIGIGALGKGVIKETVRKIRKKIVPVAATAPKPAAPRVEAPAPSPVAPREQPAREIPPSEPEAPAEGEIAPSPTPPPDGAEVPPPVEPPAESLEAKRERWESIFQTVVISDQAERWISSEGGPKMESFTQRLDAFVTLLSADLEILPLLKNYRVYVHSEENSIAATGNLLISATELTKEGPQAVAFYFNDEVRRLEGLAPMPLGRPKQPPGKDDVRRLKRPDEKIADWHLKWEAIFRTVDISNSARKWAESGDDSGVEKLLWKLGDLLTLISADAELLPHLLKYRVFVHGHEGQGALAEKGNLSIGAPDLVKNGPAATAELLVAKMRELEGLAPKVSAGETAPVPPPEAPSKMEKTPAEKLADLLSRWEAGKTLSKVGFLRSIAAAPQEQWPNFLGQAAGMASFGGRLSTQEFQEISDIIGEGMTCEQLAERNRATAETVPDRFETADQRAEKERHDPVHAFMRDVKLMNLSEEEIQIIDFQYKVIVGQSAAADGNPLGGPGITVLCSNYHDFLRERQKISPDERVRLDALSWDSKPSRYNKLTFPATNLWNRLNKGGDLAQHSDAFRSLLFGVVYGEYAPDDFAVWAKAEEAKSPAPASAAASAPAAPAAAEHPERARDAGPESFDAIMGRLNAYSQFALGVGTTSETLEADTKTLLRLEREVYPSIIPLVKPGSHIPLMLLVSEINRFMVERAGIYISKSSPSEEIIDHVREFLRRNPTFAAEGEEPMSLDDAREAYRVAYDRYLQQNSGKRNQTYNIGGDTSGVEAARSRYDAALKTAAEGMRETERARVLVPESLWTEEQATDSANEIIFNELVIAEEKRLFDMRIGEQPPKEQGMMKRMWSLYARQPRWRKMVASAIVGVAVAGATGGGLAALFYAGKRIASAGTSSIAGALTTPLFEAYDLTLGKNETKTSKVDELILSRRDDISQNLDDMRQKYKAILEADANKERRRMYIKAGIAALAGAGAAMELHHLTSVPPSGGGLQETPPKVNAPQTVVPSGRPSPLGPAETHTPPPGPTQPPSQTMPQTAEAVSPDEHAPAVNQQTVSAETGTVVPPIRRIFKLPETKPVAPAPTELAEPPQVISPYPTSPTPPSFLNPQGSDIYNLPTRPSISGLTETHPPVAIEHPSEQVPPVAHVPPEPQTLPRPGEPLPPGTNPEQVIRVPKPSAEPEPAHETPTVTPRVRVPPPPRVPPLFDDRGRIIPQEMTRPPDTVPAPSVRPPETIPSTAPAEIPHGSAGQGEVPRLELGNVPTPEAVQNSIAAWDGKDIVQAAKIAHQVEDVSRLSVVDRSLLVSSLAQKVGDKNWSLNFDNFDAEAVSHQMKDYLVAYPEAERLGFHSYAEYAGIKNVSVSKLIDQIPPSETLRNALRHSLFHRGAHIEELRNGGIHKVPLKIEHAQLGLTLQVVAKAGDLQKTVGQVLAENSELFEERAPRVMNLIKEILGRR